MYNKIVVITDIKYIPISVLIELSRMYTYICVMYIKTIGSMKTAVDTAYTNNGMLEPVPVYVYTQKEVRVLAQRNIKRYCYSIGRTDVVFKVHKVHV